MIRLRFPLASVLRMAEHAIAAPAHKPSFLNRCNGTSPVAALWFAGDDGLYLMSNGLPDQPHPTQPKQLLVVHAEGYDTSTAKHAISADVGGDDFVEVLPLLDPRSDGRTLHTDLTDAAADGATHVVIDLGPEDFTWFIPAPRRRNIPLDLVQDEHHHEPTTEGGGPAVPSD